MKERKHSHCMPLLVLQSLQAAAQVHWWELQLRMLLLQHGLPTVKYSLPLPAGGYSPLDLCLRRMKNLCTALSPFIYVSDI